MSRSHAINPAPPITKAIIVAGGQGTRIRSISGDAIPKALVPVAGEPIVFHQLRLLARYGVRQVAFLAGHLAAALQAGVEPFAETLGLTTAFFVEPQPLGTAGGLRQAQSWLTDDDCYVLYGDTAVDMDLPRLAEFHRRRSAAITVVAHPNDHPQTSDLLEVAADQKITAVLPRRNRPAGDYRNLVPAAVYCLSARGLDYVTPQAKEDLIYDVVPRIAAAGAAYVYNTPEYLRDMGTVERYAMVERDLQSGLVARMNLGARRGAVFFDRDGVLVADIEERGILSPDELELLPGAAEAVRLVNESGLLAVLVTNQPQVAKGLVTVAQLDRIHARLEMLLGQAGAKLDRIYYCPHHPDRGYSGEVPELKIECACRKPQPGMLRQATAELSIDLSRSGMIGDRWRDVGAARAAGVAALAVRTGAGSHDCQGPYLPDRTFDNVLEAVQHLVTAGATRP